MKCYKTYHFCPYVVQMSEEEFWTRYFRSKYYHTRRKAHNQQEKYNRKAELARQPKPKRKRGDTAPTEEVRDNITTRISLAHGSNDKSSSDNFITKGKVVSLTITVLNVNRIICFFLRIAHGVLQLVRHRKKRI